MNARILFGILTLCILNASAPAAIISTAVNSDTLTAGDRIELTVGLIVAKDAQVTPPAVENGIGPFVVKEWFTTKTEQAQADSLTYKYLITNYTVGLCTIPQLTYLIARAGSTDTMQTRLILMKVGSVIPPGTDTVDIKDLKPQQVTGKPSLLWLWILIAALAVAAAILIIKRRMHKNKKAAPQPPPLPPYEEAIEALKALDSRGYIMKGMVREHVFELSEIFKRYLGRRFESNASEFTTEEMLHWLRGSALTKECRKATEWFFSASDPVKFARIIPDSATLERFGTEVRSVLEATRPVIQPAQPQATPATDSPEAAA